MIKIYFHTIYLLALFILVSSCSKENITDDKTTVTTDLTLLKSNQWKVIAKENILKLEGALGGGRGTIAFTTQKPDELRWYTKHFNYTQRVIISIANTT